MKVTIPRVGPFLFLLVFLLGVGTVGYSIANGARRQAILLREDTLRKLTYSAELNSYQAEGYTRGLLAIEADDPQRREDYRAEGRKYRDKIDAILKDYEASISPDQPKVRREFDSFVARRQEYHDVGKQVFALLEAGQKEDARKLADTALVAAYRQYTDAGDVLFDQDVAAGNERAREVEAACTKAQLLTAVICIVAFLVGYRPSSS
jgi:hypothetical protein